MISDGVISDFCNMRSEEDGTDKCRVRAVTFNEDVQLTNHISTTAGV